MSGNDTPLQFKCIMFVSLLIFYSLALIPLHKITKICQELLCVGMLAVVNACFSGFTVGASLSRSSVNDAAGVKTQVRHSLFNLKTVSCSGLCCFA